MNIIAIVTVVIGAFVLSTVYYMITGKARAEILGTGPDERPEPWKMLVELLRNAVLAGVIAWFVHEQGITTAGGGLALAGLAWLGFPAVLLSGSVIWDNVRAKLAVIHGGDWLIKIAFMAVLLGVWQ
ncbi:DUF1761 domain-containing protein [Actinocrispum sp. NPDC049592]|uniref:DUF1761 domain-containing protein n=1 Tax=Actinocrispum sp. NPDC049592 TaxID=3154835 RepID=UPI00343A7FCD